MWEKEWESFGLKCGVMLHRELVDGTTDTYCPSFRCGYVRIEDGHPLYEQEDMPDDFDDSVGVTWNARRGEGWTDTFSDDWWIGFDCHHVGDTCHPDFYKLHPAYSGVPDGHFWTLEETVAETEKLAKILHEYAIGKREEGEVEEEKRRERVEDWAKKSVRPLREGLGNSHRDNVWKIGDNAINAYEESLVEQAIKGKWDV